MEDLYRRELGRMRANMLVRVPGLKESHIIRDSWTRLNVKPAKIMQVHKNITYMYIHIKIFLILVCMQGLMGGTHIAQLIRTLLAN